MVRPRPAFLSQAAPQGYVAGIGRGATGFTTRSDLGPAKEGPSEDDIKAALAKRAAALGGDVANSYGGAAKKGEDDNEAENEYRDPENDTGLFARGNYDQEDDEADRIYQDVDARLERRRKTQRSVIFLCFNFTSPFLYVHNVHTLAKSLPTSYIPT